MKIVKGIAGILLTLSCIVALAQQQTAPQQLILADVIQSHMVIQQAKPFTLWGKAVPHSKIVIKQDWSKASTVIIADASGNWAGKISVPSVKAGDFTPHRITINSTGKTIELSDILIGEVWFCTGQSNMNMSMQPNLPYHEGVFDYEKEIALANHPGMRLLRVELAGSETPQETFTGKWNLCTPEVVRPFGAVAYYFGQSLLTKLNIPVGLVLSAYGGSSCQSWTRKEDILSDNILKDKYWDKFENDTAKRFIRSRMLYNSMVHPLRHLSIKGIIWYQGESNAGDKELYTRLNSAMIKGWRAEFAQGDLPFYFVQMTPYNWKKENYYADNYAYFREAQQAVLKTSVNTGMIVTMDNNEVTRIHPRNKSVFGKRLALLALNRNYEQPEQVCQGPLLKTVSFDDDKVKITWDAGSVSEKIVTSDGEAPRHFYVAGEDKIFYKAEAKINGNTIILTCDNIKKPVSVRYAFLNYPVTNLCNEKGLPALPFRTDDWKTVSYYDANLKIKKASN